jgi:hypothetical protein
MLLSEWRKGAPNRETLNNKVLAVLKPVLTDLGADADPAAWVLWGDDPEFRYSVLAPTPAGLIVAAVRLGGNSDGPRVTGKLVRWGKLAVGELSVESSAGHRIVATQVEGQVLKGVDEEADRICEFVRELLAGIDGRNVIQQATPVIVQAVPQTIASRAVPPAPAPVPVPVPVEIPIREPVRAAKPELKAIPASVTPEPRPQEPRPQEPAAATPAGNQPRAKKPPKTPGGKSQPAWVAPHPIGLAAPSAPHPAAAQPVAPKPAPPAPAKPAEPAEAAPVWEVPAQPEAPGRESKRPRTWMP